MATARKKTTEVKVEENTKVKYRCDFKSYDEYNKYKGVKG